VSERVETISAAIMAGGGAGDEVALAEDAPCKALVDLGGKPMIEWVATAVRGAALIGETVIVEGPGQELSASWFEPMIPVATAGGTGFIDSVQAAAQALPNAEKILLVTVDIPLVTAEGLDDFARSCIASQAELSYTIAAAEEVEREFPGRGKTVVRLREGRFTGGSVAGVTRRFIVEQAETIALTFDRRKSKLALVRMFGWGFVARLALGRLSVADLEKRGSEMLGCTLQAVRTKYPGLAFDVDHAEDLELARKLIRERGLA